MLEDVKKIGLELVTEMTNNDTYLLEGLSETLDAEELMSMIESLDVLSENLLYTPEMVPVFQNGSDYLIEYENVVKVMQSVISEFGACDEEKAINMICKHNGITIEETYIVMEASDTFERQTFSMTQQIAKEKNPARRQFLKIRLAKMKERFKRLKDNNKIKLLKKQSTEKSQNEKIEEPID